MEEENSGRTTEQSRFGLWCEDLSSGMYNYGVHTLQVSALFDGLMIIRLAFGLGGSGQAVVILHCIRQEEFFFGGCPCATVIITSMSYSKRNQARSSLLSKGLCSVCEMDDLL
jgi:hypothetical protein